MANKLDNLISLGDRSEEEKKEIARKGGIASGEVRREKATMKKRLDMMLQERASNGKTYQDEATLGLIKGAIQGKAENMKLILQMLGEFEDEEQKGTPQVNINIVDHSELEKTLFEDETNED